VGTHIDPPAHFHTGLRSVDQIDPSEMVLPLVVTRRPPEVAGNADYVLSLEDVRAWERRHGPHSKGRIRCDAHRLVEALAR